MEGTRYSWDAHNNGKGLFSGQPSRRPFDRFNGEQVLFIINFYASLCEQFSPHEGRSIERKLSDNLPLQTQSEISVFNWLKKQSL